MKIYNPTKDDIADVQIGWNKYSILAGETIENIPDEDAYYWQQLQSFLVLRKDTPAATQPIVHDTIKAPAKTKVEKIEETEEVTKEVVKEEAKKEEVK